MLIRENILGAKNLDPRIKVRWFVGRLLLLIPIFAAVYFLLYIVLPSLGFLSSVTHDIVFILTLIASLALSYAFVTLRYQKFVYAMREKDFLIQRGIIEKIRYVVPYEKIQNVTVSRDLVDVMLGMGTLHIETAAHMILDNEISLPGIPNDSNLVNELIAASRKAKQEESGVEAGSEKALLSDIISELKGLRSDLREAKGPEGREPPGPLTHKEAAQGASISDQLRNSGVLTEKSPSKRKRSRG
jgi:membrane protein YdbS with pleckstrin-like domain